MEEGLQLRLWNLNSAYSSPVASHQLSCQISTNQWEAEPANCRCISGRCFSPSEKRTQVICDFLCLWRCPVSNLHDLILFLGLWSLGWGHSLAVRWQVKTDLHLGTHLCHRLFSLYTVQCSSAWTIHPGYNVQCWLKGCWPFVCLLSFH